jgi:hypothetical protein
MLVRPGETTQESVKESHKRTESTNSIGGGYAGRLLLPKAL